MVHHTTYPSSIHIVISHKRVTLYTVTRVGFLYPTQADKGEQSGFDILLEKHLNGKNAMKEMAEFFRER